MARQVVMQAYKEIVVADGRMTVQLRLQRLHYVAAAHFSSAVVSR